MTESRRDEAGAEAGVPALEAFAREWLGEVGPRLGLGLSFTLRAADRVVVVEVTPPAGAAGGRRLGEVAAALGVLCEAAARARGLPERSLSFRVAGVGAEIQSESAEAEGLVAAARAAAQVALRLGRAFALGPMSVNDRRQVHQALGEVSGVWTQSEGEGIYRRLWIVPRRGGAGKSAPPERTQEPAAPAVQEPDAAGSDEASAGTDAP